MTADQWRWRDTSHLKQILEQSQTLEIHIHVDSTELKKDFVSQNIAFLTIISCQIEMFLDGMRGFHLQQKNGLTLFWSFSVETCVSVHSFCNQCVIGGDTKREMTYVCSHIPIVDGFAARFPFVADRTRESDADRAKFDGL